MQSAKLKASHGLKNFSRYLRNQTVLYMGILKQFHASLINIQIEFEHHNCVYTGEYLQKLLACFIEDLCKETLLLDRKYFYCFTVSFTKCYFLVISNLFQYLFKYQLC